MTTNDTYCPPSLFRYADGCYSDCSKASLSLTADILKIFYKGFGFCVEDCSGDLLTYEIGTDNNIHYTNNSGICVADKFYEDISYNRKYYY